MSQQIVRVASFFHSNVRKFDDARVHQHVISILVKLGPKPEFVMRIHQRAIIIHRECTTRPKLALMDQTHNQI